MPNAHREEAMAEFWLGVVIVTATATSQAVILFDNASYTLQSFGSAFLIVYIAAAVSYIVMPWVGNYIEEFATIGRTRLVLLAFCFWIGAEATWRSAKAYAAPEGLTEVAGLVVGPETAKSIATLLTVALLLTVVEALSRLHYHGATLVKRNFRAIKRRQRR